MSNKNSEYDGYVEMLHRAKNSQRAANASVETQQVLRQHQDQARIQELQAFRDETESPIPSRFLFFGGTLLLTLFLGVRLWDFHMDYYGAPPDIFFLRPVFKWLTNGRLDTSKGEQAFAQDDTEALPPPKVHLASKDKPSF